MPAPGSSSTLANAENRKRGLAKVRESLLDRPGIARTGGPPPPTAPAQDRASPQERAVAQTRAAPVSGERPEGQAAAPGEPPINALGLDEPTRQEFLAQITPFLQQVKKEKRAKLHRKIGRSRKFMGGGV
jgi:hypothetical protein